MRSDGAFSRIASALPRPARLSRFSETSRGGSRLVREMSCDLLRHSRGVKWDRQSSLRLWRERRAVRRSPMASLTWSGSQRLKRRRHRPSSPLGGRRPAGRPAALLLWRGCGGLGWYSPSLHVSSQAPDHPTHATRPIERRLGSVTRRLGGPGRGRKTRAASL
jgi:hypothetical protein